MPLNFPNEALLQSDVLELLPVAAYACDKEGRICGYNEEAVRLWGRKPVTGPAGERYSGAYKLYWASGEYLPHDQAPAALCLADGLAKKDLEIIIERPDHSQIYVRVNVAPIRDGEGNQVGLINCLYDITAQRSAVSGQKELFRALAASEMRYKNLVDSLPVAVYTCNKNGQITFFNEVAVKLWGYRPDISDESLKYCVCYKVFVNDHFIGPEETPMAATLRTGRSFRNEQALVERPDGSRFYASVNIDPLYDEEGQLIGAINVFQDVSELKMAEKALRESEEKYRILANTLEMKVIDKIDELKKSEDRYHKMVEEVADYAIILLDSEGIILNWNKGAENIKGYKEAEIIGKSFREFYFPQDEQNGLPLALLQQARVEGRAKHEGWRKRKDGTAFWGSVLLTALHDEHNNIIGFSKVTRDLTERKFAEDRTREYLAQLEFQNKELEQFVYVASHDLKEPLRKIHLYNSYVADNSSNNLDTKSRQYLERSINATDRMKNLIEDLLTYSRATANIEAYEQLDLNQLVDELVSFHKEEFDQKRVLVDKGDLPSIKGVPFQIKQLFANLIDNAVKYRHPDRDAHIIIRNELINGPALLPFKADSSKQYYKISLLDNGIGFDAQYTERIFEIFQRLTPTTGVNGSGIGLAICKKIIQNHNGFINADGRVGKGASFHVYFPENT